MKGAELRRIRRRLGLTQRQFAQELGLHVNTLARQERDEVGVGGPVEKLARLLDKLDRHDGVVAIDADERVIELLVDREQPRRAARHAAGQGSPETPLRIDRAVLAKIHVPVRCGGRHLAVVQRCGLPVGHADHHEPAAAEVAGLGMRDAQRQRHRHGSIHGRSRCDGKHRCPRLAEGE